MFERFSKAARTSVEQAQTRARELGHRTIGPEHLLLGVLADSDGVTARVLHGRGVDSDTVLAAIASRADADRRADAEALQAIGVDLDAVRDRVEATFGPAALDGPPVRRRGLLHRLTGSHIPFQQSAKQTLVLALREAVALGHDWIGNEHILLGMLALDGDPVGRLLQQAGLTTTAAQVRGDVLAALSPVR